MPQLTVFAPSSHHFLLTNSFICFVARLLLLAILALLLSPLATFGQEATLERVVEFRDGSILQISIPDQETKYFQMDASGDMKGSSFLFSKIAQLHLEKTSSLTLVKQVADSVDRLKSENYAVREEASTWLKKEGGPFLVMLKKIVAPKDPEAEWRLGDVIRYLESKNATKYVAIDTDDLVINESNQPSIKVSADLGDWEVTGSYRGMPVKLNRELVERISVPANEDVTNSSPIGPGVAEWEVVRDSQHAEMQIGTRKIDFGKRPDGTDTKRKDVVDQMYVKYGILLSSPLPKSPIVVTQYKFDGNSSSIANGEPEYEGPIYIRFCEPNEPLIPATIHKLGFDIGAVEADGTIIQTIDSEGNLIQEFKTTEQAKQFVGFISKKPVAEVRILPTSKDENFAIGNLIVSEVRSRSESGVLGSFALMTEKENIIAKNLERTSEGISAIGLVAGLERVDYKLDDLIAVSYPGTDRQAESQPLRIELTDGSVLAGKVENGEFYIPVLGAEPIARDLIAGFRGTGVVRTLPAEGDETPLLILSSEKRVPLPMLTLGDQWVENVAEVEGEILNYNYSTSPPVWLKTPAKIGEQPLRVRLACGETIILGKIFELKDWNGVEVVLKYQEREISIPAAQVLSLRLKSN